MRFNRKFNAAAERFNERRRREDEAPRLSKEIPELDSLEFSVEEMSGGVVDPQQRYVRKIVVEHAPALFLVPCGDPRCTDGGHDVTLAVMRALRGRQTEFEGTDDCPGTLGSANCRRVVRYHATAEYRSSGS
jgi:hypothetical protein